MLKALTREITLTIQARTGTSAGVLIWLGVFGLTLFVAFCFLCVSAYAWLLPRFGSVFAGLIMAGVFVVIALIALSISALQRRRIRERAILARAAKAHGPASWLIDPKMLNVAVEAGRSLGWQRLIPVALLGFMVAQWAREYRDKERQEP